MITSEQLEEFLFLPEPRRRLNEIVNDLCDGMSVICTLPVQIKPGIIYAIIAEGCRESGLEFNIFNYDDTKILPENFIAQCCRMSFSPGEQVSVERIFEEGKIGDVTTITLPKLLPEMVKHWARLLRQWSEYARTYQARTKQYPRALLLITHQVELSRGVEDDVYLKLYYFWGWISTAELLLVARSVASEKGLALEESLWVESVFVELAGTDPELFFWLLDHCHLSDTADADMREAIIQQMIGFCEGKGWTQKWIRACLGLGEHNNCWEFAQGRPLIPPSDLDSLWSAGVASWNDGDGIFIHSAILAAEGDIATLKHRIWRGQARVLLPVLDRIRQEICDYLNRKFNREWSSFCETNRKPYLPGDTSCQNGVAEYGIINEFFKLHESKSKVLRQLRRSVEHLRLARNKLAHYVPLGWVNFSQIIGEVKKVERGLVG